MRATISIDSDSVEFDVSDGDAHLDGEFEGNVDAVIKIVSAGDIGAARKALISNLVLAPVGVDHRLTVHGVGDGDREFGVTFAGAPTRVTPDGHGSARVLWGIDGDAVGTIALNPAPEVPDAPAPTEAQRKAGCGAAAILMGAAVVLFA